MRYLLYTETFPSRLPASPRQTGIGRYCADLAGGLAALGQQVTVVTGDEIGPLGTQDEPYRLRTLGPAPRTHLDMLRRRRAVAGLARAEAADYILTGDTLAHRVGSLGRGWAVPYAPVLYGTELVSWRRAGTGSLQAWLAQRYLRFAHSVVCISRYTRSLLHELQPDSHDACIVYPCVSELVLTRPVDPAAVRRRRPIPAAGGAAPLMLVTVARISERKNQLAVLKALALLRDRVPVPLHYAMVGNVDGQGHDVYFQEIQAFIRETRLEHQVSFVTKTTDEEKIDFIDAADVVVMLSRQVGASVEGFGISAIEGSCRGKAVVVSDHGGMPETIVDGVTGVAVPPDDPPRLAEALLALARDPARREAMGQAGRRYTRERFTPVASGGRLHAQLIERGVGGPVPSPGVRTA
jgi:glycosyltransferase involved in cell wall biosynthesis